MKALIDNQLPNNKKKFGESFTYEISIYNTFT